MAENCNAPLSRQETEECAICLQSCLQPVQFPCSHIFCFLCAKGIAMQSRKCALCRSSIPDDFITKPALFTKTVKIHANEASYTDSYMWYYQGYNGWWQYDARTCTEIEAAYERKAKSVDILIAGSVYVIDFENQIQYQRHRNSRKRKIKRDLATANKKGIAGLEITNVAVPQPAVVSGSVPSSSGNACTSCSVTSFDDQQAQIPVTMINVGDTNRQIPVGSDENSQDTVGLASVPATTLLIRANSDTSNITFQSQVTGSLYRYPTYNCPAPAPDEPME